jgi:hypothetical protein
VEQTHDLTQQSIRDACQACHHPERTMTAKPVDEQTQRLDTHRTAARLGLIGHDGAAPATPGSRPMPLSSGLSHVAMSVPEGTLTEEYRARLLEFYGRMLGWHEMESLRLPDRLTVAVGSSSYISIRERPDSMVSHGYEHFGILVRSAEEF